MTTQVENTKNTKQPVIIDASMITRADFTAMVLAEYDRLNGKRGPSPRLSNDVSVSGTRKAFKAWKRMSPAEIWEFRASAHIGPILQTRK
ncbi:hypothetical protein ACC696_36640 [Rhizobium ruizarguesonis]|jgi:hypothetical protein|uniref:Uncharacterized protein n=1 Tax=Rhizobium ruizarguesonis TaxID=2081791 RepID=A0ABY1X7H0_9HYPH|nr:hypothetical protein [Rhizobium ruizarguesonis]TAX81149.1 hypothetical protein ELH98_08755 [Rhizobium ruizarguesonis]TBE22884.1 hypothetical protein ELH08_08245 [Rhizobium ruizarguesonis]